MCLMGSLAIVGVSCTPPADPQEYAGPAIVSFDTDDNSLYLVASDEGAFSIEPFAYLGIPSQEYPFYGNAAVGQQLTRLQVGSSLMW